MPVSAPAIEPVQITVVESEACHFCEDARQVLAKLTPSFPLTIDTVDVHSETGQALMSLHRAPMSPLVLLNGAFFSSGRLPRRKLEKALVGRFGHAGTGARPEAGESHHG
jgi:glutaredoxin